jgi:peptidoglycan-associated lipoprotein
MVRILSVQVFALIALSVSLCFSACATTKVEKAPEPPKVAKAEPPKPKPEEPKKAEEPKPAPVQEVVAPPSPTIEVAKQEHIEALEMIQFDYKKSDIKPEFRETLAKNAEIIKAHPGANVVIEGHCDERGSDKYNMGLGQRRADAAKNYLVGLGVAKSRIKTVSYGERQPLAKGHDETAWAKNRRAQFALK